MSKLTAAQRRVLQTCVDDGCIEVGGLDATPKIRLDVISRLALLRLIAYQTPSSAYAKSAWRITAAGRKALLLPNAALSGSRDKQPDEPNI